MLLAALGATIIGFILLIVALITANLWLAVACVVVSVVGVGLLLGDILTYHRGARDSDSDGDEDKSWSPGDTKDDASGGAEQASGPVDSEPVDTEAEKASEPVDDAAREAGTVGHEEFGHHDDPARGASGQSPDVDDTPTGVFPLGATAKGDWSHESSADTDQQSFQGLSVPGSYDPDLTDYIPTIEVEQAWGAEWTPPRDPDQDQDPDKK